METPLVGCALSTVVGTVIALWSSHAYTAYVACIVCQLVLVAGCHPGWEGLLWPASAAWAVHAVLGVQQGDTWLLAAAVAGSLVVFWAKFKTMT